MFLRAKQRDRIYIYGADRGAYQGTAVQKSYIYIYGAHLGAYHFEMSKFKVFLAHALVVAFFDRKVA